MMTRIRYSGLHLTTLRRAALLLLVVMASMPGCASSGNCGLRECPADARISAEVRALLAKSPALGSPSPISVRTIHGVVYLRGLVSTPYQVEEGASIAAQATGVVGVENQLTIDNSH
jgi:osmotically-inducible protein OsmY